MSNEFDPNEALKHLRLVWNGYKGRPTFELRIIPPRWRKGYPLVKLFKTPEDAVDWLKASWKGLELWKKNVFYGVLPRYGRVEGAGRSEDVRYANVVFCDLDFHEEMNLMEALLMGKIGEDLVKEGVHEKGDQTIVVEGGKVSIIKKPKVDEILELMLDRVGRKPSLIVDSGHGYHVYFILEKTVSVVEWSFIQSRFVELLKGDERVKDPARLLRVAGTINPRYRSLPVRCKIVYESVERLPVNANQGDVSGLLSS